MIDVSRIVTVIHISQCPIRTGLEQCHFLDSVPEDDAEEGMTQFVDGRADPLEQDQPTAVANEIHRPRLDEHRQKVHHDCQQQAGSQYDQQLKPGSFECGENVLQEVDVFLSERSIAARFQYQMDGRTSEWICLADLIFQKSQVAEMRQFGVVDINHKSGRVAAHLSAIIQLDPLARLADRLVSILRGLQDLVQRTGWDARQPLLLHPHGFRQYLLHPLPSPG